MKLLFLKQLACVITVGFSIFKVEQLKVLFAWNAENSTPKFKVTYVPLLLKIMEFSNEMIKWTDLSNEWITLNSHLTLLFMSW